VRKIEVFGAGCRMGCSTCKISLDDINHVLTKLGLEAGVIRVDDIGEAQACGVKRLPALVVDGAIKSEGKSLTAGEIKVLLQEGGI
jgi:coenzyme F420-reducing hydrogenase gamma subunit